MDDAVSQADDEVAAIDPEEMQAEVDRRRRRLLEDEVCNYVANRDIWVRAL
jgi:hypothetical protein